VFRPSPGEDTSFGTDRRDDDANHVGQSGATQANKSQTRDCAKRRGRGHEPNILGIPRPFDDDAIKGRANHKFGARLRKTR
jgi:hypothetical protein